MFFLDLIHRVDFKVKSKAENWSSIASMHDIISHESQKTLIDIWSEQP